eukprot:9575875-Alexandrium_andersonii.AAC.1
MKSKINSGKWMWDPKKPDQRDEILYLLDQRIDTEEPAGPANESTASAKLPSIAEAATGAGGDGLDGNATGNQDEAGGE